MCCRVKSSRLSPFPLLHLRRTPRALSHVSLSLSFFVDILVPESILQASQQGVLFDKLRGCAYLLVPQISARQLVVPPYILELQTKFPSDILNAASLPDNTIWIAAVERA